MRTTEFEFVELLLWAPSWHDFESNTDEPDRPAIYENAFLWFSPYDLGIEKDGLCG